MEDLNLGESRAGRFLRSDVMRCVLCWKHSDSGSWIELIEPIEPIEPSENGLSCLLWGHVTFATVCWHRFCVEAFWMLWPWNQWKPTHVKLVTNLLDFILSCFKFLMFFQSGSVRPSPKVYHYRTKLTPHPQDSHLPGLPCSFHMVIYENRNRTVSQMESFRRIWHLCFPLPLQSTKIVS
jgi:hypothetical protein